MNVIANTSFTTRLRLALRIVIHFFIVLLLATFNVVTPAAAASRIKDIASFEGVRDNILVGYGLVVGLNGTGDTLTNSPFTQQSLIGMLERLGINVRNSTMKTANVAAVMVTATLQPFSRAGTRIDVSVSALGDAKSLQGGTLIVYNADPARPDEAPPGIMRAIERLYVSRAPFEETHTVDGRTLRVRHAPLIDKDGTIVGFSGTWTDVTATTETARRASRTESWLLDVIRSSSDWVWSTDARLNLTFASPRIAETTGRPPQILVGHYLLTLGKFETPDDGMTDAMSLIARRAPFRNAPFLMTHGKDEVRRIHLSAVPMFDETTGAFAGYRGTGTDVTQRFAAEDAALQAHVKLEEAVEELKSRNTQLDIALEQAQSADKAKMDFLAMMSHELRTPLNSIIGFSDAAQAKLFGPIHESYLGYFRNIHRAGKHLLALIEDLLDTANIKRQTLSIKVAPVRAQDLITEARGLVVLRAAEKKVDIAACDLNGPWIVLADRVRARQIFANLLSNAIKFTPAGGQIGIEATALEHGNLAITVWDTGVGIAPDECERVFERFYQGENNILTRQTEGMGLGLAVARELARLMDGDITLESTPGRGTRFTVVLPLAKALTGPEEA